MTAVRLRTHYIGRGVRGRPGQIIELEDTAASRLIATGRATRTGQDPTPTPAEPDTPVKSLKPRRRRGTKAATEDPFMNPDVAPQVVDTSNGRSTIPPD